jgi:hypothetical protein
MREKGASSVVTKPSSDFLAQVKGYGLTTAEINYWMPDHPKLIQLFVWQTYDVAPSFPVLHRFSIIGAVRSKRRFTPSASPTSI